MHKSLNSFKHKLKTSKSILLIRVILISLALCVFGIKYLITTTNQINENSSSASNLRHKILSLDFSNNSLQQSQNCSESTILKFPWDAFTREQRQHGWVIIHIAVMFYGFWFLASIKDDYLIPSIEQIFSDFDIDCTVLGSTIMAAAVTSPELFINCISTFISTSDMGIGTIVGSVTFNVLAVPACVGLFVVDYLKLDWRLITGECLVTLVAILALVGILSDGRVLWYEALGMILAYLGYMIIMYYKRNISRVIKRYLKRFGYYKPCYKEVTEFTGLLVSRKNNGTLYGEASVDLKNLNRASNSSHVICLEQLKNEEILPYPWSRQNQTFVKFVFRWPITFLLWLTVPNSREQKSLKYFTLILSLAWTAVISYMVTFAITVIADTLNIPDSTIGLIVLATGISIPKAVSSIMATREGQGCMSLNNSLSFSTFDILICLGFPWFLKSYFLPDVANQRFLQFNTFSLLCNGMMLLTTLLLLYLLVVWNKFTLNRRFGVTCLLMYISFMILSVLIELNIFFPLNLPKCRH